MQTLLLRLKVVEDACGHSVKNDDSNLSEFDRKKKQVRKAMVEVRKKLEERAALKGNNVAVVRLSADIRSACKQLARDISSLRGNIDEVDIPEEQEYRSGMVVLCEASLQQLIREEKGIYVDEELDKILQRTVAALPEIDDERFLRLRREDQKMNEKLLRVEQGVRVLRGLADEIGKELDVQTAHLEEFEVKVDDANEKLDSYSERLKFALKSTEGKAKFSLYAILLVFLLAIVLYIYNMVH